mgnify:CR=1 FL=1|jgi:uncharacterized protein
MKNPMKLTQEMVHELDEFLMSEESPEDCMQLSDLDGFLTGIVVGPELIMPSEWMPIIWKDGEPNYKDAEQAEHIIGIIMARYNEIIYLLDDEAGSFEPIVYQGPDGNVIAADWAEGFMDSFRLRADAWDPLLNDEDKSVLMGPIMALVYDRDGDAFIDGTPDELIKMRKESTEFLPHAIKEIHDFWKKLRSPSNDNAQTFGKKVGRNEPCPCGSGRKYKRCCGSN